MWVKLSIHGRQHWMFEDLNGIVKVDAMAADIDPVFLLVPLKSHNW